MRTIPAPDRIRLRHILDAARKAREFVAGCQRADLTEDSQLSFALRALIQIIGEAAKKVTAETRSASPEVPWTQIAGMRDRVIHAYFDVNLDIVWTTVAEDFPPLITALESLLESESPA
jgi:uncharacterized protein with HEPN domain